MAATIEDKLEKSGRQVFRTWTGKSGEHPQATMVVAILGIFGALGVLVMLLSTSLIFNTLNALLAQNLRQIGVMKLIGARSFQILGMYLILILLFGLLALLIAAPAAVLAGYGLSWFLAFMMNANVQGIRIFPTTIVMQLVLSLLVPLGAGFVPVNSGSKIKVRRALSNDRSRRSANGQRCVAATWDLAGMGLAAGHALYPQYVPAQGASDSHAPVPDGGGLRLYRGL